MEAPSLISAAILPYRLSSSDLSLLLVAQLDLEKLGKYGAQRGRLCHTSTVALCVHLP